MNIDFEKLGGLVPAVVQDNRSQQVLMLGFMNEEALNKTLETKKVTFYSRSRKTLWTKGETSGNFLFLKDHFIDCDNDSILIKAEAAGPVCHTGSQTCFVEDKNETTLDFLNDLIQVIKSRKQASSDSSYTASLFEEGINKIAQKLGEEATEAVIEATSGNDQALLEESADLMFHFLVLLESKNLEFTDVIEVLKSRHS